MRKIFVIAGVVVLIGAAYIVINRFNSDEVVQSRTSVGDDTKFVRHESQDFSFEYPEGWFVNDVQENIFPYIQISNFDPSVLVSTPHPSGNFFKVEIWKDSRSGLTLEEWIDGFINQADYQSTVLSKEEIRIDGFRAIRQKEGSVSSSYPVIYIEKDESVYVFASSPFKNSEDGRVFENIVTSILFK